MGRVYTMEIALCNIENRSRSYFWLQRGPVNAVACPVYFKQLYFIAGLARGTAVFHPKTRDTAADRRTDRGNFDGDSLFYPASALPCRPLTFSPPFHRAKVNHGEHVNQPPQPPPARRLLNVRFPTKPFLEVPATSRRPQQFPMRNSAPSALG